MKLTIIGLTSHTNYETSNKEKFKTTGVAKTSRLAFPRVLMEPVVQFSSSEKTQTT